MNPSSNDIKANWIVDPIHSELIFKIKHLNITALTGFIKNFEMEVQTVGNDFGDVTKLTLKAFLDSLTTNYLPRDGHLMSKDFFNVKIFPHLQFQSITFEKNIMVPPSFLSAQLKDFKILGILNIKEVFKTITLNGEFGGLSTDDNGQKRAGFSIRGKISRKEFGLTWSGLSDSGTTIVGDEVDIVANIQLIKIQPSIS